MKEILDAMRVLQETPVPNLLILFGALFLLLAFAGALTANIKVSPTGQKYVGILGAVLLLSGIGLFVVPGFALEPTPTVVAAVTPDTPTATPISPTSTSTPTSTLTPSPTATSTFTSTATSTPSPTQSPTPTATDTSTLPPPPPDIACGPVTNPGCLIYVSPQLAEIRSAVSFLFPLDRPEHFTGEYTDEAFHSEPISIKLTFNAARPNFGGWGIGGLPGYDVSGFQHVSFYLRGTAIGQTFEFKLKDTDLREDTVLVTVGTLDWTEVTSALDRGNFPTVNFASLENINLGFNDSLGSATIYVDDFAFLPE